MPREQGLVQQVVQHDVPGRERQRLQLSARHVADQPGGNNDLFLLSIEPVAES